MNNRQKIQIESRTGTGSANGLASGLPTLAGPVPPGLQERFQSVPGPDRPEFVKLPSARGRCPFTGASRTWLLENGGPEAGGFIVRIRQRGKTRGAVFVDVDKLLAYIRQAQQEGGDS